MSITGGPVAVRIPAALLTPARLSEAQLDGHACVVCGLDYLTELTATSHMPVGVVDGGQVFACSVPCASPEGDEEAAEEVELVRADDFGVIEVVRLVEGAPVVRLSSGETVHTWTADRAFAAAAILLDIAEGEAVGDEEAVRFAGVLAETVVALITAARMVRDEIAAAA